MIGLLLDCVYPRLSAFIRRLLSLIHILPTTTLMGAARGIQHQLGAVAVFKGCGAGNGRAARAQGLDDLPREGGKATRPSAGPHARRQLAALGFTRPPFALAGLRSPKVAAFFAHQRATRTKHL